MTRTEQGAVQQTFSAGDVGTSGQYMEGQILISDLTGMDNYDLKFVSRSGSDLDEAEGENVNLE